MRDVWVRNKRSKLSSKSKILLEGLTLLVIVGVGTVARAASDNTDQKPDELLVQKIGILDPFTLRTNEVTVRVKNVTNPPPDPMLQYLLFVGVKERPEIRIPFRPAIRSPFRPPLILR
jgi:hypothetical protein